MVFYYMILLLAIGALGLVFGLWVCADSGCLLDCIVNYLHCCCLCDLGC